MSVINIRRDVSDKYYRYKMPKLISKVEGKGNGIKTVIPNMSDIAKSLSRPPTYPTKFFGCELGAQVKCDEKNDRYIVNGAHDAEKLAALLDGFIDKFVLCPSCKNPETDLVITKDECIMRDCKACGAHLPVDIRHKLVAFILKDRDVKKPKKERKKKDISPQGKSAAPTPPETVTNDSDEDDDKLTRKITAEAALIPESKFEDDDWGEDTSAEAVAARIKDLAVTGAVAKLMNDEEMDPIDIFGDYLTVHPNASDSDILHKAQELDVRNDKVCAILAQTLFNQYILTQKQMIARSTLFKQLAKNEKCQMAILGGLERLVGMTHPSLLPKIPVILKTVYDLEWVDEEVFLAWGDKSSKKYVSKKVSKEIRDKAAPFLNWLKEAEEED